MAATAFSIKGAFPLFQKSNQFFWFQRGDVLCIYGSHFIGLRRRIISLHGQKFMKFLDGEGGGIDIICFLTDFIKRLKLVCLGTMSGKDLLPPAVQPIGQDGQGGSQEDHQGGGVESGGQAVNQVLGRRLGEVG